MQIESGDLRMVSILPDDPEINRISQDYDILQNLSETRMYSQPMPSLLMFRIEYQNQVIGEAGLKTIKWFNRKAEISIFLAPEFQGKGIGRQAMTVLMGFAFRTVNLYRLEAEVTDYNERARNLFRNLGFTLEGRLREAKFYNGKYYDILQFGMLRPEYDEKYK